MSKFHIYHVRDCASNTNVMQVPRLITDVNTIAERLKEAREALDLTQDQVALLAGVSQGTIANIEAGIRKNPRELLSIASAVRVSPEWLKDGKGPRSTIPHDEITPSATSIDLTISDKSDGRAPVIEWARLGTELLVLNRELRALEHETVPSGSSDKCKWVRIETDHPRLRIKKGQKVALDPVDESFRPADGDICLFSAESGLYFLAEYRRLSGQSYEAIPDAGFPMDKDRHGIRLIAVGRGVWW